MDCAVGFPHRDRMHHKSYENPYTNRYSNYGNRERLFQEFGNHQRRPTFGSYQSPFGSMGGGYSSTYMGRGGSSPMMGNYSSFGFSPSLGMGMGMGMGQGMGYGMQYPGRIPHLSRSSMGYRQSSPFGFSGMSNAHPTFSQRSRGHSSWPRQRRSHYSSHADFFGDEDSDDEGCYDTSSMFGSSRRRRGGDGYQYQRHQPYGSRLQSRFFDDHNDYGGYDDFDDDDDDDDFDDPCTARQFRRC